MYAGLKFALKFAYILPYKICGKRSFMDCVNLICASYLNFSNKRVQEIWQIQIAAKTNTHI
jgi:hypothetical protein